MTQSLLGREHPLASTSAQLRVLNNPALSHRPFDDAIESSGLHPLTSAGIEILQVNVGKLCNQTCNHCHVDAGPDRTEVMTRETAELCVRALENSEIPTLDVTDNGRIASVVLKKEMYSESGTNRQDTEGIVNLPRSIKGIQVAVLFSELDKIDEDESIWKVSLRSKGEVDVSMIAERFCGGGHKKAAGCVMKGSLKDVKQKMYSILSKGII